MQSIWQNDRKSHNEMEKNDMKKSANIEFILYRLINILFFAMFLSISSLILIFNPWISYMTKKTFLFSNMTLLLFDVLVFVIILLVWRRIYPHVSMFIKKYATHYIIISSMILFCIQLYVSYHIYFATGWDVGNAVIPAAKLMASGNSLKDINPYFSIYPNNIVLVWIFAELIKIKSSISSIAGSNDLIILVVINCFISSLTGILLYKCVERLTNIHWAVFSWILYVFLIGLSPWLVITYSDSLALFLPILIYFIYTSYFYDKFIVLKWGLIGILSFLGYYIKPQVIIILIAIMITEIWKSLHATLREKMYTFGIVCILGISFILSGSINQMIGQNAGFATNEEDVLGWSHFVMMGLNDERDGVYSDEDVAYSVSFHTSSERKAANLAEIKNRLNNFGVLKYLNFLSRKTLVNYGDGTFAWSEEGGFYMETYEDKDLRISPLLKSFYYYDGNNYKITSTLQQALWVAIIISMLGLIFIDKLKPDYRLLVLMLALIGLTMFELIFEARARYLYIYSPIYIALSVVGLKNILYRFRKSNIHTL